MKLTMSDFEKALDELPLAISKDSDPLFIEGARWAQSWTEEHRVVLDLEAAFTEAVELIDELEKLIDRYNRMLPQGWDKPALARALKKIEEFKEKGE